MPPRIQEQYDRLFANLFSIPYDGPNDRIVLSLTEAAQACFIDWHNQHFLEADSQATTPFLQGCYNKLKGYCARLALIDAVVRDPSAMQVGIESLEAGIALTDYFKAQAFRVDGFFSTGKDDPVEKCKAAIRRKLSVCRYIKRRELQRSYKCEATVFNQALKQMSQAEIIITQNTVRWNQ